MYAQNILFKASFELNWSIEDSYVDDDFDNSEEVEVHYYSPLKYEGKIVDISSIPSDF